jgi:hypothetical protein
MRANSLQDLYLAQLKDLYDAEHQLIKLHDFPIDGGLAVIFQHVVPRK